MKQSEILAALPQWNGASSEKILSSPAWAMPCRLGDRQCVMRLGATAPAETLNLSVRLEEDEHVLGIVDSPQFSELHSIWAARGDVPEPILLALVEKECGPLLQLLENASRRQLKVSGLAATAGGGKKFCLELFADGESLFSFTLTASSALERTFGMMRFIDMSHPSVREVPLQAEREYAAFAISAADMANIAPGDALLLPEVGTTPQRLVVDGRFVLSGTGVAAWKDEGLIRVVGMDGVTVNTGDLLDAAEKELSDDASAPPPNTPMKLVRAGAVCATGRFGAVGTQPAFIVDDVAR